MAGTGFRLEGAKELQRQLDKLDGKLRRKGISEALKKPAKTVVSAAKANLRAKTGKSVDAMTGFKDSTGLLVASIGSKRKVYRRQVAIAVVGPRTKFKSKKRQGLTGAKAKRNPSKYAHLVEYGTKPHWQKFTRIGPIVVNARHLHPGTPAKPFLGPAIKSNTGRALKQMQDSLRSFIKRAARQ